MSKIRAAIRKLYIQDIFDTSSSGVLILSQITVQGTNTAQNRKGYPKEQIVVFVDLRCVLYPAHDVFWTTRVCPLKKKRKSVLFTDAEFP